MKTEPMEVQSALERGLALPYALVRSLSRVTLSPTPETVDPRELIEACFFSDREEIRVFQGEDGLQAVRLLEEAEDDSLPDAYPLMDPVFGKEVTLCRELAYDEDGQAYVAVTRLTGWKGGET